MVSLVLQPRGNTGYIMMYIYTTTALLEVTSTEVTVTHFFPNRGCKISSQIYIYSYIVH